MFVQSADYLRPVALYQVREVLLVLADQKRQQGSRKEFRPPVSAHLNGEDQGSISCSAPSLYTGGNKEVKETEAILFFLPTH
jgi:hypothetical protein